METSPFGGLLHYAFQLADGLAVLGHDVDLIVPRGNELKGRPSSARMLAKLTPVVQSAGAPPPGRLRYLVKRVRVGARYALDWWQMLRLARRGKYDAIVINCDIQIPLLAAAALFMTRLAGRSAVTDVCHNVRALNRWRGGEMFVSSPVLEALLRRAYSQFDLVFVHGERGRAEFVALWGNGKVVPIRHGNEQIFAEALPPSGEERILFFGHWNRAKGIDVLRAAFDELAQRRPTARLTIAGSPNPQEVDVAEIRDWANSHGERVELLEGYVPLEAVPPLFRRARVVAIPYTAGFQSGVVHLAMTLQRAVVASDIGDIASIVVDGETGLLVPSERPAALASALEMVIADPAVAKRLGAAGRERMLQEAAWEKVAKQVETALLGVIGRRTPTDMA